MMYRAAEDAGNEAAAERCRHVAHKPPRTFWEAVQLLWFVDVGVEIGDDSSLINPGRLDRRLIRFYERDLMEHRITYRDAVEAFALIYLYLNHTTPSGLAFGVMLDGGTVNDLSYASIDAVRLCRLVYPSVGVCANEKTPHSLKRLAIDVIAEGYPNPSFFNDAVIRKGLEYYGVPEDIRGNYINSTCVEITPCGYSNVWVASPYYNLSQMLLENLETEAADFDAFMENYHKILAAHVKTILMLSWKTTTRFSRRMSKTARRTRKETAKRASPTAAARFKASSQTTASAAAATSKTAARDTTGSNAPSSASPIWSILSSSSAKRFSIRRI